MSRLQSVQNAAARLVLGGGRSMLRPHRLSATELHWLPVRRRVDFKMATMVYLSLSGMTPAYLTADWSPTTLVVSCVLPHQGRALSDEPIATMETGVS